MPFSLAGVSDKTVRIKLSIPVNNLPSLSPTLKATLQSVNLAAAQEMLARAQANLESMGINDTGALSASGYISSQLLSTYAEATETALQRSEAAQARGKTPKGRTPTIIQFSPEELPKSDMTTNIAFAASYAGFIEFPSGRSGPGKYFLSKAAASITQDYFDAITKMSSVAINSAGRAYSPITGQFVPMSWL